MLKKTILGTLHLGLLLAGCGSSSDGDDTDAGKAGSGAGTTAGTTAGSTAGSTAGTTAGTTAVGDGGLQVTCDDTMKSVDKCGSDTCGAPDDQAAMFCQVNCCTDDNKCGHKFAAMGATGMLGQCQLAGTEDTRCASRMFMGNTVAGCCTSAGNCGVLAFGSCVDPSTFGQGKAIKCDGSNADEDAGM